MLGTGVCWHIVVHIEFQDVGGGVGRGRGAGSEVRGGRGGGCLFRVDDSRSVSSRQ